MSRDGAITPPRKPATVIAAVSGIAGNVTNAMTSTSAVLIGEADGRDLAVALGAVGEEAAREHADGAGAEIGGQRDVGGRV